MCTVMPITSTLNCHTGNCFFQPFAAAMILSALVAMFLSFSMTNNLALSDQGFSKSLALKPFTGHLQYHTTIYKL